MDIKEVMVRKYGPMPVWAWTALFASFIAGLMLFKKKSAAKGTSTGGGGTTPTGGEFNSAQSSTTTDANGNQTTSQYSATGPLTGIPGFLTNQAGAMPYSGGDVYVNYPSAPLTPGSPPPQQTTSTNPDFRTVLNTDKFNTVGWSDKDKQAPWRMEVAQAGETWNDLAARTYHFADNFSKVTDPGAQAQVKKVADYLKRTNSGNTGMLPDGSGPTPGAVVVYR